MRATLAPIDRILKLRKEGHNNRKIADILNQEGLERPRGGAFKYGDITNYLHDRKRVVPPIKTWSRRKKIPVQMVNLMPEAPKNAALILGSAEQIAAVLKEMNRG